MRTVQVECNSIGGNCCCFFCLNYSIVMKFQHAYNYHGCVNVLLTGISSMTRKVQSKPLHVSVIIYTAKKLHLMLEDIVVTIIE